MDVNSIMQRRGRTFFSIALIACAGSVLFVAGQVGFRIREAQSASALPVILDRVQAIGELHTARQNAETVISMETHREPEGWASGTPIGTLVEASTSNTALVSVKGSVEAGIDLSRAKAAWKSGAQGRILSIQVPSVKIYDPSVSGTVHSAKRGLMWRDDGISLKALDEAKTQFRQTAREGGLAKEAEENARKTLESLLRPLHDGPVEILFGTERA